jgi:hypothetical protein
MVSPGISGNFVPEWVEGLGRNLPPLIRLHLQVIKIVSGENRLLPLESLAVIFLDNVS